MGSLCVVAFPVLSKADNNWLQSIRSKYDPQYKLIAPHITLLFPSSSLEISDLTRYVKGAFNSRPNPEVPYIPHMTIGAFDYAADCSRVADEINSQTFVISGQVQALSIISGSGPAIVSREIALEDGY